MGGDSVCLHTLLSCHDVTALGTFIMESASRRCTSNKYGKECIITLSDSCVKAGKEIKKHFTLTNFMCSRETGAILVNSKG